MRKLTQKEAERRSKEVGIEMVGEYINTRLAVDFKCRCGQIFPSFPRHIWTGHTIGCGHCNDPKAGDQFGLLTIIKVLPAPANGCRVEALCKCSGKWYGKSTCLTRGNTKSCGCISSQGNSAIKQWLNNHNIEYIAEMRFDNCRHKRCLPFDFYISHINLCIEYNGSQHYHPFSFRSRHAPDQEKGRDKT